MEPWTAEKLRAAHSSLAQGKQPELTPLIHAVVATLNHSMQHHSASLKDGGRKRLCFQILAELAKTVPAASEPMLAALSELHQGFDTFVKSVCAADDRELAAEILTFVMRLSNLRVAPYEVLELCGGLKPAVRTLLAVVGGRSDDQEAVAAASVLVALTLPEAHFGVDEDLSNQSMAQLCARVNKECNALIRVCVDEQLFDVVAQRILRDGGPCTGLLCSLLSRLLCNTMQYATENTAVLRKHLATQSRVIPDLAFPALEESLGEPSSPQGLVSALGMLIAATSFKSKMWHEKIRQNNPTARALQHWRAHPSVLSLLVRLNVNVHTAGQTDPEKARRSQAAAEHLGSLRAALEALPPNLHSKLQRRLYMDEMPLIPDSCPTLQWLEGALPEKPPERPAAPSGSSQTHHNKRRRRRRGRGKKQPSAVVHQNPLLEAAGSSGDDTEDEDSGALLAAERALPAPPGASGEAGESVCDTAFRLLGELPPLPTMEARGQAASEADEEALEQALEAMAAKQKGGEEVPERFCCEITGSLMRVPVRTPLGSVFEHQTVTEWLLNMGSVCPTSGAVLRAEELELDTELQEEIKQWAVGRDGV